MQVDLGQLEDRLWDAADELRANSGLKASEYGTPVLGLIVLRFADAKFAALGHSAMLLSLGASLLADEYEGLVKQLASAA